MREYYRTVKTKRNLITLQYLNGRIETNYSKHSENEQPLGLQFKKGRKVFVLDYFIPFPEQYEYFYVEIK